MVLRFANVMEPMGDFLMEMVKKPKANIFIRN